MGQIYFVYTMFICHHFIMVLTNIRRNIYPYRVIPQQTCFTIESNLGVTFNKTSSSITTSALEILWNDPSAHADIIKEYQLEIAEFRGTFSINESVGRANHHVSFGPFVPGHLFVVTVTSVLHLNDIGEKAYIRSDHFNLVVGRLYTAEKIDVINHE